MAEEETTTLDGAATAVADRPDEDDDDAELSSKTDRGKKKGKKDDDDLEYEVEFATPFGKLEFEFEPLSKKEKKDRDRKAKAERDAAKKAALIAKLAEREPKSGGGAGKLLVMLLVIGLIGATIALAYWLFARTDAEADDVVPPEFANDPQPAPQGVIARARARIDAAVHSGRQASREAQREQREKFERMTGGR